MVYEFHKRLTDFGEVLRFRLFSLFLWSRMDFLGELLYWCGFMLWIVLDVFVIWMGTFEFSNHAEFHESTTIHGFLMSL